MPPGRAAPPHRKPKRTRLTRGGARVARRVALVPLLVLVLAVSAWTGGPGLLAQRTPAQVATSPVSAFSGVAARAQVDALAVQIGSRPAGSPAYDQAVQYAVDQL